MDGTAVSLVTLTTQPFEEDTYILGTLLSVKSGLSGPKMLYKKFMGGTTYKKGRFDTEATYHRMLMFRETSSSNGKCFVILLKNGRDFTDLMYDDMKIGDVVSIVEPVFSGNFLSSQCDVPIISTNLPDEFALAPEAVVTPDTVKSNPICNPDQGCTLSFRREGVSVTIKGAKFKVHECKGTLCDRQKKGCTCMYNDFKTFNYVMEFMVSMDGYGVDISFSSLQFTRLVLVVDTLKHHSVKHLNTRAVRIPLREKLKTLVTHVNDHGGWNVIGWMRAGEKVDQIDGTEKVVSDTIAPHIVRLQPTTATDLAEYMFNIDDVNKEKE